MSKNSPPPNSSSSFAKLLDDLDIPTFSVGDQLFYKHGPLAMGFFCNNGASISASEATKIQRQLHTLGVMHFQTETTSPNWFYIGKTTQIELDKLPTKKRYEIKKGLTHCMVRQLTSSEMLAQGALDVGEASAKNRAIPFDRTLFKQKLEIYGQHPDLVAFWGVFVGEKMAGFSINYQWMNTLCYWFQIDFDPLYFANNTSHALVYKMTNAYFLKGFHTINAGFKRIYHETQFQTFLISKFGFSETPIRMDFHISPLLRRLKPFVLILNQLPFLKIRKLRGLQTLFLASDSLS